VRGRIRINTTLYEEARAKLPSVSEAARDIIIEYAAHGAPISPREVGLGADLQVIIDDEDYRAAKERARLDGIGLREVVELGLTHRLEALHDSDAGAS